MKININSQNLSIINDIFNILNNENSYLVGGFVRDSLLNRDSFDMDFTTELNSDEVYKLFPHSLYFKKFGTVSFKYQNISITIATLRKESDYKDYRHPLKIEFVKSVEEDYLRRDFSINAIYVDKDLNVIDPSKKGIVDIENKIISTISDPLVRFKEDPLRIIRAFRFKHELNFEIENNTYKAATSSLSLLSYLNKDKIMQELHKCDDKISSLIIEELNLKDYLIKC